MFTARYGLIPYIKEITFSLAKVNRLTKRQKCKEMEKRGGSRRKLSRCIGNSYPIPWLWGMKQPLENLVLKSQLLYCYTESDVPLN